MSYSLASMRLWSSTLGPETSPYESQKEILRSSLENFRERVAQLVSTLGAELPNLTVHDVTHLDALWRVADEIAGPGYPINPAEAYVLGATFLLHDAAHVIAAYPGGLREIKQTNNWRDLIAQRYESIDPPKGSDEEKSAIFQVVRHLHAEQARKLPGISWKLPDGQSVFLIENDRLRSYYGDLIGEIASSHHWPAHQVADVFVDRLVAPPSFLETTRWTVDSLKIAFLLRTADAAHLDDQRAPWFLLALRQPKGISLDHWRFQAKMGQPVITENGQLLISAGAPFWPNERKAWWLAFDTARMIDRELRDANAYLKEGKRPTFAARSVASVETPHAFSRHVRVEGWEPVDVQPTIGDVPALIRTLGGTALYGDNSLAPLRELLQNGLDAVRAARGIGQLSAEEGEIEVAVTQDGSDWWLSVLDTGIGMSRRVLTSVLLDFGNSLWRSDAMREELPGLASSTFRAVGKFGIGFYSIFMLGEEVSVTTRRYERASNDTMDQWRLLFEGGLDGRPTLTRAVAPDRLKQHGTRVAVKISTPRLLELLGGKFTGIFEKIFRNAHSDEELLSNGDVALAAQVAYLCPTSDVNIRVRFKDKGKDAVKANDWTEISDSALLSRVRGSSTEALVPLRNDEGMIIGRVGIAQQSFGLSHCCIAYQGIACSEIDGLAGVVCASGNNIDAKRTDAQAGGTISAWSTWASEIAMQDVPMSTLLRLHPLIPEKDFAVWNLDRQQIRLAELESKIATTNEVVTYVGEITYDNNRDDVSEIRFGTYFKANKDLVIIPTFSPPLYFFTTTGRMETNWKHRQFPWNVGVEELDYVEKFEQALLRQWGNFEKDEIDDVLVGEVAGSEIYRSVFVYKRL